MYQTFLNPEAVCENDGVTYYQYPGNDRYLVSKCGKVYDTLRETLNKISQITDSRSGLRSYYNVHLKNQTGTYSRVPLHRMLAETFIANNEGKSFVDHLDRDNTNNDLLNLRWVTHQENMRNRSIPANNATSYVGVSKRGVKFRAYIKCAGSYLHLGTFPTALDAARAYNQRAEAEGFLNLNKLD